MARSMLVIAILAAVFIAALSGCTQQNNMPDSQDEPKEIAQEISGEERQRMDLYLAVMQAAFQEENGGAEFIAVKLDTLVGLNDHAKKAVLEQLTGLAPEVYDFADVEDDATKFQFDEDGRTVSTINGSLLWVEVEEYHGDKATITGVSWFGNLGAVFPSYEAVYRDGKWSLKLISMAVS